LSRAWKCSGFECEGKQRFNLETFCAIGREGRCISMHGSITLRYNVGMDTDDRETSATPSLQYATPQNGPPREWMPCIAGLFVWGSLILLLVLATIVVVIYDAIQSGAVPGLSDLAITFVPVVILISVSLPPLLTARHLMRGELRGAVATRSVLGMAGIFTMPFSCIASFVLFGTAHHNIGIMQISIMPMGMSVGGLWLAAQLFAIARPDSASDHKDRSQTEATHVHP
jgi:hypothetical protein